MNSIITIMACISIGLAMTFLLWVYRDIVRKKKQAKNYNFENDMDPFIDIPLENFIRNEKDTTDVESIDELRKKIEAFNQRNRFYRKF